MSKFIGKQKKWNPSLSVDSKQSDVHYEKCNLKESHHNGGESEIKGCRHCIGGGRRRRR